MSSKQKDLPFQEGLAVKKGQIESAPQKKTVKSGLGLPEARVIKTTAEEEAEAKMEGDEIADWLCKISKTMPENLSLVWKLIDEAAKANEDGDEVLFSLRVKKFREVKLQLETEIGVEHPVARRGAREEYADAFVRTAPLTARALRTVLNGLYIEGEHLPGLVELGLFKEEEEKSDETIRIQKKHFAPVDGSTRNLKEISSLLREKAAKVTEEGREWFESRLEGLKSQGKAIGGKELTLAELVTGTPGQLILNVPDKTEEENGKVVKFFGGGFVLLLSNGTTVEVIDAVGHFQKKILELRDTGRKLSVGVLANSFFDRNKLGLPPANRTQESKDAVADLWLLHSMLRRGIEAVAAKEERRAANEKERERLQKMGNVLWEEWLLDGVEGTTCIFLKGAWKDEQDGKVREYFSVLIVMERRGDGWIRLIAYNLSLKDLLGNKFSEWMDPKERFEGVNNPLGNMLRKMWAIARGVRNRQQREQQHSATAEASVQSEPTTSETETEQPDTANTTEQQS